MRRNKSSQAFDAGVLAGQQNKPANSNPETHPDERASWQAGWEQGQAHIGKSLHLVGKTVTGGKLYRLSKA